MTTSLHDDEINFQTSSLQNKPHTSHIKCSDYDIQINDNFYPALWLNDWRDEVILKDVIFKDELESSD